MDANTFKEILAEQLVPITKRLEVLEDNAKLTPPTPEQAQGWKGPLCQPLR